MKPSETLLLTLRLRKNLEKTRALCRWLQVNVGELKRTSEEQRALRQALRDDRC